MEPAVLWGILADSHGLADKLRKGIDFLRKRGVGKILHLGDVVDTLRPETVDVCVSLLVEHDISGVMGNHEYSLVTHHFKRYPEKFSEQAKHYVRSLPWRVEAEGVCLTHFSPLGGVYGLFAPTDDANYEETLRKSPWPIIVNGHSHDPRIYRQCNGVAENVLFVPHAPHMLDRSSRYILTCGALEDSYCALFDLSDRRFEIVLLK
jgi:predicted phosphodiesterase